MPTTLAPKNQRSFRELVGSSECFPGQYRRGQRQSDFSLCISRTASLEFFPLQHMSVSSKCFRGFLRLAFASCYRKLARGRHVQGFFTDPPRAFSCRNLHPFLSKKMSAHGVHASAFQSLVPSQIFFRRVLFLPCHFENQKRMLD